MPAQEGQAERNPNIFVSPTFQTMGAKGLLPYLFNPQNIKFLKGEQPYIANEVGVLPWIGTFILVLTTLLAFEISFMVFDNWQLDEHGVQTQALVTNKYEKESKYWLDYTFNLPTDQAKTSTHSITQTVNQATYETSRLKASITIIYVPDNPDNADVVGNTLRHLVLLWVFIFLGYLFCILFIIAIIYRRRVLYIKLAQKGVLIWGRVTKSKTLAPYSVPLAEIRYEFKNPDGRWVKKRFLIYPNRFRFLGENKLPNPDASVLVIYIDDKNHTIL
jgi:hypothetical protein